MGLFDWLLNDPTQSDGGFLARLALSNKPGGASAAASEAGLPALPSGYGGLLGESPLVNLLRSGFAGMNAANGYTGFGPQFAAGMKGGSDLMDQRRPQMIDQINALKLKQALQTRVGDTIGDDAPPSGDSGAATANEGSAGKPCATCAGAGKANDRQEVTGSSPHFPVIVSSPDEVAKLPPGTWFRAPDGRVIQRGTAGAFNQG